MWSAIVVPGSAGKLEMQWLNNDNQQWTSTTTNPVPALGLKGRTGEDVKLLSKPGTLPGGCHSCFYSLSILSPFGSIVWRACRTARAVTPAAVTAARTPSTKQPRRRASSLPSDVSLGRRRRADPAFLARTPPVKVSFYYTAALVYVNVMHAASIAVFLALSDCWTRCLYMFLAGTPEAESSPKDGLGMGTLGGPAEKNRKLQKK